MKIGNLYIGWRHPDCYCSEALQEAKKTIQSLHKEALATVNAQASHDRDVILNYLQERDKDELQALDKGLDSHWRPLK